MLASLDPFDRLVDLLRRKRISELKETIGMQNLTTTEMSELSSLNGSMTKDLVQKAAEAITGAPVSKTKLTIELKCRGVGEVRGWGQGKNRKRAYVWGERENPDKSDIG